MSIHRWQKEFSEALRYKSAVILSNNVRDKYLYLSPYTDSHELLDINECLVKLLSQNFNTIKLYDPVEKIIDRSPRKSTNLRSKKPSSQEKMSDSLDEELKKDTAREREMAVSSESKISPVAADLILIKRELDSEEKCSVIMTLDNKTLPRQPSSLEERTLFLYLEKIIQYMKPSNRLILIFLSDGEDLSDLYKNNPRVKIVNIPSPDRNDLRILFQHYWRIDKGEIEKAVNISHGLKFLEVEQLISSINPFDIKKFEEAVRLYKFGEKRDYWQEVSLEKLRTAGKFFLEESTDEGRGGIKGQDDAIRKVLYVLVNAVADIQRRTGGNPSRPKGVLFFAGPTGVGKTLTAQKLANFLFGSEDKLLRFDMSEYKDEFQVTRLYGAPPGYVGYESGGTLTTAIKENPFSVILFDEIEKAHPRIVDIFLQILSDGRLTDSKGETVYFSEAIIIFTSNIGTRAGEKEKLDPLVQQFRKSEDDEEKAKEIKEEIREHFRKCVENYFTTEIERPELLGRIGMDNIVVFDYIPSKDVKKMFENYLLDLQTKFNKHSQNEVPRLQIAMDIGQIANNLFEKYMKKTEAGKEYGGRDVVNMIDQHIRNPLAQEVLKAKARETMSGTIRVSINNEGKLDVRVI